MKTNFVILFIAIIISAGCLRVSSLYNNDSEGKRAQCAAHLKGFACASMYYALDNDGWFPNDLTVLAKSNYILWEMSWWQCPSTGTKKSPSLENLSQHCDYLYFGKGIRRIPSDEDKSEWIYYYYSTPLPSPHKVVVVCDKPGNHDGFICFAMADGRSFAYKGSNIEDVVDEYDLILPGRTELPIKGAQ